MDRLFRKLMLGGSSAALVASMPVTAARAQDQNGTGDIEQVVVACHLIAVRKNLSSRAILLRLDPACTYRVWSVAGWKTR